jgi:hypothetical protein
VRPRGADRERRDRSGIAALLGYGEFLIDTVVALALIVGGTILLGVVVYDFVRDLGQGPFIAVVLELLSGLLLVFIFYRAHHYHPGGHRPPEGGGGAVPDRGASWPRSGA